MPYLSIAACTISRARQRERSNQTSHGIQTPQVSRGKPKTAKERTWGNENISSKKSESTPADRSAHQEAVLGRKPENLEGEVEEIQYRQHRYSGTGRKKKLWIKVPDPLYLIPGPKKGKEQTVLVPVLSIFRSLNRTSMFWKKFCNRRDRTLLQWRVEKKRKWNWWKTLPMYSRSFCILRNRMDSC